MKAFESGSDIDLRFGWHEGTAESLAVHGLLPSSDFDEQIIFSPSEVCECVGQAFLKDVDEVSTSDLIKQIRNLIDDFDCNLFCEGEANHDC